jgi:hypothetical protein
MGGAAPKYTISGTVYDTDGSTAVASATVALGTLTATSGVDGTYTISNVPAGTSGSMTCTKAGLNWTAISVSAIAGNLTSQNYTANYNLLTSLAAYWKLDESSAGSSPVTRSDSIGGMHLTDNNTVASATGIISNGGAFVVADQTSLSHVNDAVLQMGDIDFTLTAWANPSTTTGFPAVVSKDNSAGTRDYMIQIGYPTTAKFGFQVALAAGGTKNVANTLALSTGQWYFVVAWHDATADKIYLQVNNGTPAELATTGALASPSTNTFRIGAYGGSDNNWWGGTIDEVGIWKRVLTATERTALYNGGAGFTYPF